MYWANEEPADRIKLRIIQSFFEVTDEEMRQQRAVLAQRYLTEEWPVSTGLWTRLASVEEADEYAKLNKPDVMFMDQLDKFRIKARSTVRLSD